MATIMNTSYQRDGKTITRWQVKWRVNSRSDSGKAVQNSFSETFNNKKDALARKNKIESQLMGGGVVVGRKQLMEPFSTFAASWFTSLRIRNIKKNTSAGIGTFTVPISTPVSPRNRSAPSPRTMSGHSVPSCWSKVKTGKR